MRQIQFILFSLLFSFSLSAQPPRLLITTDIVGDPDDQQSLVRLMVYSNELQIEAGETSAKKNIKGSYWIVSQVDNEDK